MINSITKAGVIVLSVWMTLGVLLLVWLGNWIDGWQEHWYRKRYRKRWIKDYHKYKETHPYASTGDYEKAKKHPSDPYTVNFFPYWRKPDKRRPGRRWEMIDKNGPRLIPGAKAFFILALVGVCLEAWFFIHVFKVKADGNTWTVTDEVLDRYIIWPVIITVLVYAIGLFAITTEKLLPKYARSGYLYRDIPPIDEDERV